MLGTSKYHIHISPFPFKIFLLLPNTVNHSMMSCVTHTYLPPQPLVQTL